MTTSKRMVVEAREEARSANGDAHEPRAATRVTLPALRVCAILALALAGYFAVRRGIAAWYFSRNDPQDVELAVHSLDGTRPEFNSLAFGKPTILFRSLGIREFQRGAWAMQQECGAMAMLCSSDGNRHLNGEGARHHPPTRLEFQEPRVFSRCEEDKASANTYLRVRMSVEKSE